MLLATNTLSYPLNFEGVAGNNDNSHIPPRIISEIRKSSPALPKEQIRPKISGELLVKCGNEKVWWPRRVVIRGGQLLVGSANTEETLGSLRIPLRHLSLAAGSLPNSVSLYKGLNIILTLQTASERTFDLWVKTIAIELIRQTPLDAVKYLDILTLAERQTKKQDCVKDWNSNYIKTTPISPPTLPPPLPIPTLPKENDQQNVEILLKRCQNSDSYVPVKDKLVLFESLCRLGRKVRSSEDVSVKIAKEEKKATSMYDLSNCDIGPGVREICRYFENKRDEVESQFGTITRACKRLVNSDTHLHNNNNIRMKTDFYHAPCS